MAWQAVRRATLLIPSGPAHDPLRKHLHIVLNDPHPDSTLALKVLVVSVMSIPSSNVYDPSCTLFPGEHPFVVHHSYVAYQFAALQDPANLQAKVNAHQFVAKPLLSDKAFGHVVTGLQESPYTQPRLLKYFLASLQSGAPTNP